MRYTFALAVFAMSLLAACNNTPPLPTIAPTLAVTTAPQVTATTAAIEGPAATNTRGARPSLPPTWTPTPMPSATPFPTEVIATQTPFVAPNAGMPAECNGFDIVFAESTQVFQIGTSPKVTWKAVPTAVRYRLELGDVNGRILKNDIFVAETTYTFDPSLFSTDSILYSWSVYPIKQAGDQMCFEVGGEMTPSVTDPSQQG